MTNLLALADEVILAGEKATPGKWSCGRDPSHFDAPEITKKDGSFYVGTRMEDAAFIALTRTAAPALAQAYKEAVGLLKEITDAEAEFQSVAGYSFKDKPDPIADACARARAFLTGE